VTHAAPASIRHLDQHPDLIAEVQRLHVEGWPTFLRQNQTMGEYWPRLDREFGHYQFCYLGEDGRAVACGNTIPIPWDGTVEDLPEDMGEILKRGVEGRAKGERPTVLCALAALVTPARQGQGMSRTILETMRALAREAGLEALIAPVRPNRKSDYPLIPMERYARWVREDGSPFDPWLRTHWRLGAAHLGIAPRALVIEGTIAEWESWTGMEFPDSGSYVVAGGLTPVEIDRRWDRGVYEDPNVWMRHSLLPKE
jgi:GNAT superfamily N-acetyltransferase